MKRCKLAPLKKGDNDCLFRAAGSCSAAGPEAAARPAGAGAVFVAGQSRVFTVTSVGAPRRAVPGKGVVTRRLRPRCREGAALSSSFGWARAPMASVVPLEKTLQTRVPSGKPSFLGERLRRVPRAVPHPTPPAWLSASLATALSLAGCAGAGRRGRATRLSAAARVVKEPVVPLTLGLMEMS